MAPSPNEERMKRLQNAGNWLGTGGWFDRLHAQLAPVEQELWLIALATLTIDVYLTYRGLQAGFTEGNPLMSSAFETLGFAVLGLVKAVALGLAGMTRAMWPEYGPFIPLGLSIPWLFAVLVNVTLLF